MKQITVEMLNADLAQAKMTRRGLASALSLRGRSLTEAGLSLWWQRGKVPGNRYTALAEILGPNSQVAQAVQDGAFALGRPPTGYTTLAPASVSSTLSPEAQMLGEWLDKIPDGLVKFETFQACNALIIQALRRTQPTLAPALAPAQETPVVKAPA